MSQERPQETTSQGEGSAATSTVSKTVIKLEDFADPRHDWIEMNDPVMGGKSVGNFTIYNGIGHFVGTVKNVPFLHAPGFVKVETKAPSSFPDISSCQGLQFTILASSTEAAATNREKDYYTGYRVSFGHHRPPDAFPHVYGYKTNLKLGETSSQREKKDLNAATSFGTDYMTVQLPFTSFTDNWDAGSGDPIITCQEDKRYCPDEDTLRHNLYSIAVWGEGVLGDVDLKIALIEAYDCYSKSELPTIRTTTGSGLDDASGQTLFQNTAKEDEELVKERFLTESNDNVNEQEGVHEGLFHEMNTDLDMEDNGTKIMVEDFRHPKNHWTTLNDPVMGGRSTSSLDIIDGKAHFHGHVAIVPSLQAPGFITMATGGFGQGPARFPNVESCAGLELTLRSLPTATENYAGYYLSFGNIHLPDGRYASGYKTHIPKIPTMDAATDDEPFGTIRFPFADFSAKWDDATGHILVPCSSDHPEYCPDASTLQNMKTISIWGEGVEGYVDMEIQSIQAYDCASSGTSCTKSHCNGLCSLGQTAMGVVILFLLLSFLMVTSKYWGNRRRFCFGGGTKQTTTRRTDYTELNLSPVASIEDYPRDHTEKENDFEDNKVGISA